MHQTKMKQACFTTRAIKYQLTAMGCSTFDIGLRHEPTGQMLNFELLSEFEIIKRIDWFKAKNKERYHIYVRPSDINGLLLVDDLTQLMINRMIRERVRPALVIETSPNNFQAWVRICLGPINNQIATMAAKLLAKRYNGDSGSADFKHYGRLAGFTNVKPKHVNEQGQYPYVKVGHRSGQIAERGTEILRAAHRELKTQSRALSVFKMAKDIPRFQSESEEGVRAVYERLSIPIEMKYQPNVNYSKLDWMVTCQMLSLGYSEESIKNAIISSSKNLQERKGKYVEFYANLTVEKALIKVSESAQIDDEYEL